MKSIKVKTNFNTVKFQNKKSNSGITIISLIVTIVVLVILAGFSINIAIGDNGIIKRQQEIEINQKITLLTQHLKQNALKTKISSIGEQVDLTEEYLKKLKDEEMIEEKDIDKQYGTYITLENKYVYSVEEKNNDIVITYEGVQGKIKSKIVNVKLNNTSNTITAQIQAKYAQKYNFYIKDSEQNEYTLLSENTENTKFIYTGLKQDSIYYLKVEAINENGKDTVELIRGTGVVPTGTITIGDFEWDDDKETAAFVITTTAQEYDLQYTTTPKDSNSWVDIESGTKIENIEVGKTVYARLWDKINEADEEYVSATVQPQDGRVILSANMGQTAYPNEITVNVLENLSKANLQLQVENEQIAIATISKSPDNKTAVITIIPGKTPGTTTLRVISGQTRSYKEAEAIYEITVEKGTLNVTSTGYTGIYDGMVHEIDVICTQGGANITYSQTENGTYGDEKPTYTNAGVYTTYYKVDLAGYYTYKGHETVTIGKQKVLSPTNLQVTTEGKVYWDESSNATGYEISIDNSNWQTATSGIDYLNKITEQKGTRTVYVKAVNNEEGNYATSDNAVKDVQVVTLTINKNNIEAGIVDCASYNVISGVTYETNNNVLTVKAGNTTLKEVTATANVGYSFNKWSIASGTITQDTTVTAEFDINTYNITWQTGNLMNEIELEKIGNNTIFTNNNGEYTLATNNATEGIYIPEENFEVGKSYVLSYKIQKTAGRLISIGGHSSGTTQKLFTIDGNNSSTKYNLSIVNPTSNITDDTNVHTIIFEFIYNGDTSNNNIYIQPNRGYADSVTLKLTELELYKVVKEEQKQYNSLIGTLPQISRLGYTLDGWYTQKTNGIKITDTNNVSANDVTYYTHWQKDGLTLENQSMLNAPTANGTKLMQSRTYVREKYTGGTWVHN